MTRQEQDHERYMRERDKRLKRQRAYYRKHRKKILAWKHETGALTYGTARKCRRPL